MLSIVLVLLAFIMLVGLTIVIVETHNASLMVNDEPTILKDPRKDNNHV